MDIKIINAPDSDYSLHSKQSTKIFLAGGISNCSNWQIELIDEIENYNSVTNEDINVSLYNPRRDDYDISDKSMEEQQICWEYKHLQNADIISFWFTKETVCPITLYELGHAIGSGKKVIIGMDDQYSRKNDVKIQSLLNGYKYSPERSHLIFPCRIKDLAGDIIHELYERNKN